MDSLKWHLFFTFLFFKVIQTKGSSWKAEVPSSVQGLEGSCVVVPCTFRYQDPGRPVGAFTGMWLEESHGLVYHPVQSKVMQQYQNRTEMLGDVAQRSCSLKIDPLKPSDRGPFYFRIEIADYDKFSYADNKVTITTSSEPRPITFSVKQEVETGENVSASCSVTHSCPASPPTFSWGHTGEQRLRQQKLENGQWQVTSTLTFDPTADDHKKPLECSVTYRGGRHQKTSKVLTVKHAPVNVNVRYRSNIKEGEAVQLTCSSDAHPPPTSYEWHNEAGARVHQGNIYLLKNVSRHTGPLYCTAINKIGEGKSNLLHLNVLYAPEIKTVSSCSSEADMVKCVCIADSRPPSLIQFVLPDKVLPITKLEKHGSVSIGTLQAELGPSELVYCVANNTEGIANLTLPLRRHRRSLNLPVIIATGAGMVLVTVLLAVAVKKWGRSGVAQRSHVSPGKSEKDVALPQYASTSGKGMGYAPDPDLYNNDPVYGNMENVWDEATYANM